MWDSFIFIIIAVISAIVIIAILQRYYYKSERGKAIIRTGFGGQRIILEHGMFVLPFLHHIESIPLNALQVTINTTDDHPLLCADKIRIDLSMEITLRVAPDPKNIACALTTIGSHMIDSENLFEIFKSRLMSIVHVEVAKRTLEEIHNKRSDFMQSVCTKISDMLACNGLLIDGVALSHFSQTKLEKIDPKNALHAQGLCLVSEKIAKHRVERAHIEADADLKVHESEMQRKNLKLQLEQQQQQVELETQESMTNAKATSNARIIQLNQQCDYDIKQAQMLNENALHQSQVEHNLKLRQHEAQALELAETSKIESSINVNAQKQLQMEADIKLEKTRGQVEISQYEIQKNIELLRLQHERDLAVLNATKNQKINQINTAIKVDELVAIADAQARSDNTKSDSEKYAQLCKAESHQALIDAENTINPAMIQMKIEQEKIRMLPTLAEQISKPLEKLESIKINHLGGFGTNAPSNSNQSKHVSPFSTAVEDILSMSVQLPALKKIGEQIGLDIDAQTASRISDAAHRAPGQKPKNDPHQKTKS